MSLHYMPDYEQTIVLRKSLTYWLSCLLTYLLRGRKRTYTQNEQRSY